MRALVCPQIGGEDLLEVRDDWPAPTCGAGQVRVEVHAASVNFPDVLIVRDQYQVRREPPFVPGNEVAGVVVELGDGVTDVAIGDRVLGLVGTGGFAEEAVIAPPLQAFRMPDEMPFDQGAAFGLAYGTAAIGVERGALAPGERVLVNGAAGGVGSAAVQVAKAMGATVVAVAGGEEKVAVCRALGADHVVDHTEVDALAPVVKELTAGRGVDVVFDNVGGPDVRDLLRCMAWNGRYLVVGFAGGEVPIIGLNQTILKSISVVGVAFGASAIVDPAGNVARFERLFEWYRQGLVSPYIGQRFPLAEAAEAMRTVHERRALGKVVVEVR